MNPRKQISSGAVLTGCILLFALAAFPSSIDAPFAFSIGRVWAVTFGLIAALLLSLTRWTTTLANFRALGAKPYNRVLALWFLGVMLSASFAPASHLAFLGSTWSQMGVWQLGLALGLFYFAQTVELEAQHWKALAAATGVLLLLTFLEAAGFRPLFWLPQDTSFPAVTIGQRGHLAGLFAVIAGVAIYRRAYPTTLMCGIGTALCNNSSATLAVLLVCVVALCFDRNQWKPLLIVLLCSTAVFWIASKSIPTICRLTGHINCQANKKVGSADQASLEIRVLFWKSAFNMFKARPIIGWGNEQFEANWINYLSSIDRRVVITQSLNLPKNAEYEDDFPLIIYEKKGKISFNVISNVHPHNIYVEELETHGLLGFLLAAFAVVLIIKSNHRLAVVFAGYGVYLAAWFLIFSVLPIFSLLLGTLLSVSSKRNLYE